MPTQLPTLKLSDLTFAHNDANKLAFSATGEPILIDPATGIETPLPALPSLTLGIGQAVTVPQRIQDAFSTDGLTFSAADFGLWLTTGNTAADEPTWFGSFTTAGIDLYGVHDLPGNVLQLAGMNFGQLALRIALQVRGSAVTRTFFAIAGVVQINQSVANIDLDGLTLACGLTLDVTNVADLGSLLEEPASILDAAFTGQLHFAADARRLAIGTYFAIDSADCDFDLAVHSPANDRALHLGDIDFRLQADAVTLVGAQIEQLDLACGYQAQTQRLYMRGSADVSLPGSFDSVLAAGASTVRGSVDFEHRTVGGDRLTTLIMGIDTLTLAPAINFLELRARDIALTFTYLDTSTSDDVWTLTLGGISCQSWGRLADRLAAAGILQLPNASNLPDVQGRLAISLQDSASSGLLDYRLDFLTPGTGCRTDRTPVPFDNTFGPLPMRLANSHLSLSLAFDQNQLGDWQVQGEGLFSTTAWLHDHLPLNGLAFSAALRGSGEGLPEVELSIVGGMPGLRLPPLIPGMNYIEIFQPQRLAVRLGETLALDGQARVPSAADLLADLNLPSAWDAIIGPISELVTNLDATLAVRVPLADGDDPARMTLTLEPLNPPEFRLMEALSQVVRAVEGVAAEEPDPETQIDSSGKEFFTARPHRIRFELSAGGDQQFALTLSFSFLCSVFGETFDATAAFRFVDGQPEFLLMAGLTNPIRLVVPGIAPEQVLGGADLSQIAADYHLDQHLSQIDLQLFPDAQPTDALATLQDLENRLRTLFGSPGMDNSLVFEIRDFGLRVRLDSAPSVSGTVRLVQLPGILDAIMPENGFDFGMGCSVDRIFISVKGPATRSDNGLFEPHESEPLFSLPLGRANGQDQFLNLFFGRFELEYSWTTNAFGFVFDAAVVPVPDSLQGLNVLGNGIYFPGQSTFVKISKSISTGHLPIIIPEWAFSFAREASSSVAVTSAADELGLQLYIGAPDTRVFTAFFKEFTFSPTYYLMQPGIALDGGVVIGPHQPLEFTSRDAFFGSLVDGEANNQFLIHYEVEKGVAVLMPAVVGGMLNPLTLIPPFLNPMPPFWIYPPHYMGDIYFDSLSMSVNLPHLLFFGIRFRRPLPTLSIQGMMELAALVMSGFAETIPDHSELRQVMYATLEVNATLPLIELLTGPLPSLHLFFEVNVIDIVNGIIRMGQAVQQAIADGVDIVETLLDDPGALVRMIPVEARHFAFPPADHPAATYELLGFSLSGSLYILTPEEFAAELKLFHEGLRVQPKGLAASQPNQRIATDKSSGPAPLSVQFSIAPAGNTPPVSSVQWDFGDGSGSAQPNPIHTFAQPGQYRVSATRTDIEGQTQTSRQTIVAEGAAVHQAVQLQAGMTHKLRYISNPLTYFSAADSPFQHYFQKKAQFLFADVRNARKDPRRFENKRRKRIQQWLDEMWKPLASTAIDASGRRKQLWQAAGIGEITEDFEKRIKKIAAGADPKKPIGSLAGAQQGELRNKLAQLVLNVLTQYTLVEGATPADVAQQIVKKIFQTKKRVSRRRASGYTITLLPAGKRLALYKDVLPPDRVEHVIKGIESCLKPAVELAQAGKMLKREELHALQEGLVRCISGHIQLPPGKIFADLDELPFFQVDEAALFNLLARRVATRANIATRKIPVTVFNGGLTQRWLTDNLSPPAPADDAETIDEMVGYEIRSRPHASGQTFTVPVAHAAPLYRVQRHAGRYQLILFDGRDILDHHELPDWLSNDIPETPDKPEQLRARLFVTERILTRPRTAAEAAWVNTVTHVDDVYQKSVFARPEYEIKPEGGVHGAMSIGDLLRLSNGDYMVPGGPALLTGCVVNVWNIAELKLAGLLAAPNNIFLNGYAQLSLELGRYTLSLEGDFRLIAGDMWANALSGNSEFAANVLNFHGSATFKDDGVTKLRGAASGTIGTATTDLDVSIEVEYHDNWTLEIADTELFKVTLDAALVLHVTRTNSQFQFAVGGNLGVAAWVAGPDMVTVEVLPEMTACAQVPILPPALPNGPFFTTECLTTPAVEVTVPDFSNPDWQQLAAQEVSADIQIIASNDGLGITLHVEAGDHDETFDLPRLVNL